MDISYFVRVHYADQRHRCSWKTPSVTLLLHRPHCSEPGNWVDGGVQAIHRLPFVVIRVLPNDYSLQQDGGSTDAGLRLYGLTFLGAQDTGNITGNRTQVTGTTYIVASMRRCFDDYFKEQSVTRCCTLHGTSRFGCFVSLTRPIAINKLQLELHLVFRQHKLTQFDNKLYQVNIDFISLTNQLHGSIKHVSLYEY